MYSRCPRYFEQRAVLRDVGDAVDANLQAFLIAAPDDDVTRDEIRHQPIDHRGAGGVGVRRVEAEFRFGAALRQIASRPPTHRSPRAWRARPVSGPAGNVPMRARSHGDDAPLATTPSDTDD